MLIRQELWSANIQKLDITHSSEFGKLSIFQRCENALKT